MKFMKTLHAIALTAATAFPLIASAQDLTIAIGAEPTTLDPQLRDDGGERHVNDNVFETLLTRDPSGSLIPSLAMEMPEQVDPTTWRFKLKSGVNFHNGEAFDAQAVVFSVNRIIEPEYNSEQMGLISTITGAVLVDEMTVDVTTDQPDPILPARMSWIKMVPPVAAMADDFASAPVGTGPYRFESWNRGTSIALSANEEYWGGAPELKEVEIEFIVEFGTRLSNLLAGEIDLMTNLLPEFVKSVPQALQTPGSEVPILVLNTDEGPTADVRIRQALNYAVDKDAIADSLYNGAAHPANGQILAPTVFGYDAKFEDYPYDPDRARELIAEAGAEGVTVELVGTSGRWIKDREIVEVIAQYWSEVGIEPNVRIFEWSEFLNRVFDPESRPESLFLSSSSELLDADKPLSTFYHVRGIASSNTDPDLASLIDSARYETDSTARQGLYSEALKLAYDQAYFVYLVNLDDIYGASEQLEWTPRPDGKLLISTMSVN